MRCEIDRRYECREHWKVNRDKDGSEDPCLHCLIFMRAFQHIFNKEGKIKMSDFMNKLHEKAAQQPEQMPLADVPDEIEVRITKQDIKVDGRGNECVYLYLVTKNNKAIVQKYPPSAFVTLEAAIHQAGGLEVLQHTLLPWKKQTIARLKFDRLLPLPKPKEKKEK